MKPEKIKILLIEDDYFLTKVYLTKFELEGFEIVIARDGKKGLEASKKMKPDVILLDILLPGMDGFEVLEKLKADKATRDIPVVMMTNLSEDDNVKKALKLGAVDYLIKSNFLPAEIIEKVKRVISN